MYGDKNEVQMPGLDWPHGHIGQAHSGWERAEAGIQWRPEHCMQDAVFPALPPSGVNCGCAEPSRSKGS